MGWWDSICALNIGKWIGFTMPSLRVCMYACMQVRPSHYGLEIDAVLSGFSNCLWDFFFHISLPASVIISHQTVNWLTFIQLSVSFPDKLQEICFTLQFKPHLPS